MELKDIRKENITKANQTAELLAQDLIALRKSANTEPVDGALLVLAAELLEKVQKIHSTLNYLDSL
jgi:hypothetical protein